MDGTIDGLLQRRTELVARRRKLKGELTQLAADTTAIDRVIRMIDPDYKFEQPTRVPATHSGGAGINPFPAGQMVPAALEALRKLDRPVTSSECAEAMLEALGIPDDDSVLTSVTNRVSALLSQKAESGQVMRSGVNGRQVLWEIQR